MTGQGKPPDTVHAVTYGDWPTTVDQGNNYGEAVHRPGQVRQAPERPGGRLRRHSLPAQFPGSRIHPGSRRSQRHVTIKEGGKVDTKVLRKILALPPTGFSWADYDAEQEAKEAAAGVPAVKVYLDDPQPRMEMAGATYALEGADLEARRAYVGQQVTERARNLGQPIRVSVQEEIGSAELIFHPDGQMEVDVEPAAEPAAGAVPAASHGVHGLREDRNPFQTIDERRPSRGALAIRYLLIAVVAVFFLTGVRTMIWPYGIGRSAPATQQSSTSTFPAGEASQVAARFATSYLSWDERKPQDRATALELDLAVGLDNTAGWSGRGVQTVRGIYAGQVTQTDAKHGHVIVQARVAISKLAGGKWVEQPGVWRRLSVPVVVGPTRVVVSGTPAYVPESRGEGLTEAPADSETDSALTAATKADGRAFFTAYATSNEATAAITAPSAGILSLQQAVQLQDLKSWTVLPGDSDRRTALATVTWKHPGAETVLEQDYRLTLLRSTAADGTQRWQVAALINN